MKQTNIQFQIDQLRKDKMIVVIEAIAIQVFALFVSAYLPQILLRYYYAGQQLFEEPALLTYIPVVSFGIGTAFVVYALVSNFMRWRKIKSLEEEMMFLGDSCCGGDCGSETDTNWDELDELDRIVEEAIAESKAEAKKAVSKTKKATKKAKPAAKTTATKKKKATSKTSKAKKKATSKKK
jgi:hypothetical protein